MARKYRWRVPTAKREEILQTARREKLSGADVAKRFGISAHTYYSWRSPARGIHVKAKRNGEAKRNGKSGGVADIRSAVRAQIQHVLPSVIREEVDAYMSEIFGARRGRGRPRIHLSPRA